MDTPTNSIAPGFWMPLLYVPWMAYQVHPPTPYTWITSSHSPSVGPTTRQTYK
jgi:hypothetical protein